MLKLNNQFTFFKDLKNFYKSNNCIIKSSFWVFILALCWKDFYQLYLTLNPTLTKQITLHKVLFFLQLTTFIFPFFFMKKVKLILGRKNIVARKFSETEINNSRWLYGLDTLLDGERIWAALVMLPLLFALPFLSEQANILYAQLKYTFFNSLWGMLIIAGPQSIWSSLIWITVILLMPVSVFSWFMFWILIIVLICLGISSPYILPILLLINFINLSSNNESE